MGDPSPSKITIDPELLRRWYVDERLTTEKVAARIGCAPITIRRWLRRFEIPVRPRGSAPIQHDGARSLVWCPELAYAVGLMATDGNLSSNRRHMSFVSRDLDLAETLRACLGVASQARKIRTPRGRVHYRVQWCSRRAYDWFLAIGLTPAKSLTLGPLAVPDQFFADFFRGCIDGDGSICVYTDRYHTTKKAHYVYERLYVSIVSASHRFIEWIQATVARLTGLMGSVTARHRAQSRNPLWKLCFAKRQSLRLMAWLYHAPDLPSLARKRIIAERFLQPLGHASKRPRGRPRVGWLYVPIH